MSSKEFADDVIGVATYTLKVKDGVNKVTITVNKDSVVDDEITVANAGKAFTFSTEKVTTEVPSENPTKETTTVAPTTGEKKTDKPQTIKKTGDAGIAVIAGVSALAAVAFVVTKKK